MSGIRFTTWLDESEREALRKLAHKQRCSENFVVRIAMRALLFNEPIPSYLKDKDEVTSNVRS